MPTDEFSFAHLANDPDVGVWRVGQPKIGITTKGQLMLTNEDLKEAAANAYDDGYDEGYNVGYDAGVQEGYEDGANECYCEEKS